MDRRHRGVKGGSVCAAVLPESGCREASSSWEDDRSSGRKGRQQTCECKYDCVCVFVRVHVCVRVCDANAKMFAIICT